MLNCGIHPCPLKCHQISDHSQMPCQHPYSGMCSADRHKLKWKCYQLQPDPCIQCKKEAERAEEKRRRELELKEKLEEEKQQRLMQLAEEQLEHDLRMAEIDAKLQAEQDAMADAQIAQQRADDLKQRLLDLSNARKAAVNAKAQAKASSSSKVSTNTTPNPTPPSNLQPNSPPPRNSPTPPSSPPLNRAKPSTKPPVQKTPASNSQKPKPGLSTSSSNAAPTSAAHLNWLHQKQVNGESNSAIDGIMELTGLEDVKAQVLSIKASIDLMKRQGVPTNKERLNLVLLGNPGTGEHRFNIFNAQAANIHDMTLFRENHSGKVVCAIS